MNYDTFRASSPLLGTPGLLSNGYRVLFPEGKGVDVWSLHYTRLLSLLGLFNDTISSCTCSSASHMLTDSS
jgi:hypothetical protein